MAADPKRFQKATIKAALNTLTNRRGARRFLVADEVGLGKTVVARGVIEGMMERNPSLSVMYVCSSLTIAAQNLSRLVAFLSKEDRKAAQCKVDRPSLLVTQGAPTHGPVQIYSLTPQTAVPTGKGQSSSGRKEERALAYVMLLRMVGEQHKRTLFDALLGNVRSRESLRNAIANIQDTKIQGVVEYQRLFDSSLRDILGLETGQHLPPRILELADSPNELARIARSALALASLQRINPDLVIFDEFQKFSDLVQNANEEEKEVEEGDEEEAYLARLRDRAAARLLSAIRGRGTREGPALLLLSATPYEPYKARQDASDAKSKASSHAEDFFQLIKFLSDDGKQGVAVRNLFVELSEEMRKGLLDSERAKGIRTDLENRLGGLMSRTERPQQVTHIAAEDLRIVDAELEASDLRELARLRTCFSGMPEWVLPMWQSVPLPMQTMGYRYVAWKEAAQGPMAPVLSAEARKRYERPEPWPHPRLRALLEEMPTRELALPWVAPSARWWPLADGWKGDASAGVDGKLLVFSKFRAVPPALAGLVSYSLETRILKRFGPNRTQIPNRQWLQPDSSRAALLELFYPSPFLASLDPLPGVRVGATPTRVIAHLYRELRRRLSEMGVRVVGTRSRRPEWRLLLAIEAKKGLWGASKFEWKKMAEWAWNSDVTPASKLAELVDQWDEASQEPIDEISEHELEALARLALDSPGVVLFRALQRHWGDAGANLGLVLSVVWKGLRNYLDSPWFATSLQASGEKTFPRAIRQAVISGNLEAVFDEHFWYLETEGTDTWPERLEQLETALKLRDASVTLHEHGPKRDNASDSVFRLGCHVAVPLNEAKIRSTKDTATALGVDGDGTDLRPDLVRRAFNSPFWPRVLITTSVGQEGLDFHPWCRALAHWDLAPGPVALEQREGRITRFAGLSVRRVIGDRLRAKLLAEPSKESPWSRLAALAEESLGNKPGLAPWWFVEADGELVGSTCRHLFFAIPASELRERHAELARERALYRLVLGMPDQADLLSHLTGHVRDIDAEAIRRACLNLSAYSRLDGENGHLAF